MTPEEIIARRTLADECERLLQERDLPCAHRLEAERLEAECERLRKRVEALADELDRRDCVADYDWLTRLRAALTASD